MKEYTLMFEFYGHKLKTKVLAKSEAEAKAIVSSKIIFRKTLIDGREKDATDVFKEGLNDIFNMDMFKNSK